MSLSDLALHIATIIAAFFQSVTGIGFGMIAGPVVLVILNDPSAVLISTLMSWLIALCLWPSVRRDVDSAALQRFLAGAVLGLPGGLALLTVADVELLKTLAGLVIAAMTAAMLFGLPGMSRPGLGGDLLFGALGGLFGACLAMPGPTVALRLAGLAHSKTAIRGTMVTFFCAVWPIIFAGQVLTGGIDAATLWNAAALIPATLGGVAVGQWATERVSERLFRRMVIFFLLATSASLLAASVLSFLGEA